MSRKTKHHNKGNHSNRTNIPYKPVPEIITPGIVTDPDSKSENNANPQGVERLRGWNQQHKM